MSYQSDAHKKKTIYKFQSTECDLSPDVQYLYGAKNVYFSAKRKFITLSLQKISLLLVLSLFLRNWCHDTSDVCDTVRACMVWHIIHKSY